MTDRGGADAIRCPEGFEIVWPNAKAPFYEDGLVPIRGLFWRRSGRDYLQALMIYREWIACEAGTCGPGNE